MKKMFVILAMLCGFSFAVPTLIVQDVTFGGMVREKPMNQALNEAILKAMGEKMDIHNADIRNSITSSGLYKVVDEFNDKNESTIITKQSNVADYTLNGNVIMGSSFENIYDIPDTNNSTYTKTVSIFVEYQLINNKTHEIAKAFNSNVSGSETQNFNTNKIHPEPNLNELLSNLSKNLADNVVVNLKNQKNATPITN